MRNLSWKTLFFYLPDLVLLLFFFLSVLNLDLVAFHTSDSTEFSKILNGSAPARVDFWVVRGLWSVTHSLEAVLFIKILLTSLGTYVLIKALKKSMSPTWVAVLSLVLLFFPSFQTVLRSFHFITWFPAFLFFALAWTAPNSPKGTARKKIAPLLLVPALLVFAFEINRIVEERSFQEANGRLHDQDLEMTLKMKKSIYALIVGNTRTDQDPFTNLHGRAVDQMRAEELGVNQSQPSFGLYQALTNRHVIYQRSLIQQTPDNAWFFQLRSQEEMALEAPAPFLLTELKADAFPRKLVLKYFNEKLEGIEKIKWPNGGFILPMAFVNQPQKIKTIRLEFELDSESNKYLNILTDHYRLLQVRINRKMQPVFDKPQTLGEIQNQWVYKIPDNIETAHVVIELAVPPTSTVNYSRLDVFSTGYLIAPEDQGARKSNLLSAK